MARYDRLPNARAFSYVGLVDVRPCGIFTHPRSRRRTRAMKLLAAFLTVLMLGVVVVGTASAEVTVKLEVAADGLTAPLNLVTPPDGTKRRFITEQIGVIRILMPDGKMLDEPFLNIRHRIPKLHPGLRRARPARSRVPSRTSRATAGSSSPTAGIFPGTPRSTRSCGTTTRTTSRSTGCRPEPEQGRPAQRADRDQDRLAAVQPQRPLDRIRARRVPVHLDR